MYAHPPGPGLPLHAPSVKSKTSLATPLSTLALHISRISMLFCNRSRGRAAVFYAGAGNAFGVAVIFERPESSLTKLFPNPIITSAGNSCSGSRTVNLLPRPS